MYEKRLKAVAPQAFTADGTADGKVTVADASLFKVKQQVIITATGQPVLNLQINQIDDIHTILVGEIKSAIRDRTDVSAYTVALGAAISADEQQRPNVPEQAVERATYEDEPVVARRVILVDKVGDKIDEGNPLPVTATFDGDVHIGSVRITACDDDPSPGDTHSSVRISDCDNDLKINADGSINVVSGGATSTSFPAIQNILVPLANTEYSAVLPTATKRFIIKSRSGDPKIQLSYTPGDTNTIFVTIRPGVVYAESAIFVVSPMSLYFQSNKPGQIVEIVSWI